jgi:endonuclease YncB( thermonuclease family)
MRRRLITALSALLMLAFGTYTWRGRARQRTFIPPVPRLETVSPELLEGVVVGISDGDTVTILDASKAPRKIRLLGIDAPESSQPFGKAAKQALSNRILMKSVTVLAKSMDRYNRVLGKIQCGGTDINLDMVRAGLAWHYKHYADDQFPGDAGLYAQAEREARTQHRGLWKSPDPMEPWQWRQSHRLPSHP